MVISCSSKLKPKVIDRNNNEVLDPTKSPPVTTQSLPNFFGYEAKGQKGVSAGEQRVVLGEGVKPLVVVLVLRMTSLPTLTVARPPNGSTGRSRYRNDRPDSPIRLSRS